jgi:type IV pilus assembly protein PilY1
VANDGTDDSAPPATVSVTINPINDLPTAGPVSVSTDEDTPVTGTFVGADPVEGSALSYSVSSAPSQGSVSISGGDFTYTPDPDSNGGDFTYTPDPDSNGSDSFEYVANDGTDDSAPATVSVTINPINDQPTADAKSVATDEDTPLTDSVTGGDVDGDGLTFTEASGPASGTLTLNADGTFTYTPDLDFNGSDSFSFTASDGTLTSATAVVDITVNPINDAPVADPQTLVTDEDTVLGGAVSGTDVEGDTLTYAVLTAPASGVLALNPDGSFTYTPNLNFNGSDSFEFFANDGAINSAAATIDITINPVNDAPEVVGVPPTVLTTEDSGGLSLDLSGLFGDVDGATNGDTYTLSVSGISGSVLQSADIVGTDLDLLFVPNSNGAASVTVTATDTGELTADAVIDIEVTPVNDAPIVVGSVADVVEDEDAADTTVNFSTVFEDVDVATNGDVLTLSVSAVADGGFFESITPSGNSVVLSYLPDKFGTATLTVRATDLAGNFTEYLLDVTVNSVNDAPFVDNPIGDVNTFEDAPPFTVNLSLLFDDVDIATNGDVLTLSLGSVGNSTLFDSIDVVGTALEVTLAADQSGSSIVTIRAEDSFGEFETYTFSIDVISVNDEPVAVDDTAVMDEDGGPLSISVLDNDYLAEEPTTISSAGVGGYSESEPLIIIDPLGDPVGGPNGQVAITGTTITYEPKPDFNGVDYFTYAIMDNDGDTVSGTVTITVNPVNDPPTTSRQTITHDMLENTVLMVDAASADGVLTPSYDTEASVADASGNPIGGVTLSANVITPPAVGSLTFDTVTGAYEFEPPIDFTGLVSFAYRIYDGSDESDDFLVQVNVIPAPPAPEPPPAGEVSILHNLSNVPLEQSASVPANVLVLMDDSGSMDWNMIVNGDDENGGFVLSNESRANGGRFSTTYVYLYDLTTNAYPSSSDSGRVLPTEEALDLDPLTVDNEYGVWRARSSLHNKLYYNPEFQYEPWVGLDVTNTDFANADPTAVRLDPRSTANTINLEGDVFSWDSTSVPQWDDNGGRTTVDVDGLYIPYYYATTASPPLAWDSPHSKIEIRDGAGPLAGGLFPGGSERGDCRVGDDNPFTCTYTQEMQNFANWFQYYRSREYVTKDSIGKVIAAVQDIRVGYETVSNTTSEPIRPMNDLYSEGNKLALLDNVYDVDSYGGTPLRQLLGRAGQTFGCLTGGDCPALPPPDGMCQQNFALLFSDGYWNGGAGVSSNTDDDGVGPFDGGRYGDSVNATLADTAMYYYENDLFDTVDDRVPVSARDENGAPAGTFSAANPTMHQHMKTYAIAFGVSGSINPADVPTDPTVPFAWTNPTTAPAHKIDDMLHAAINGRGSYLNASNPRELRSAFEQAFLEFTQASSSTSAAAFNSTSLRDGTLLYRGFYDLRDNTGELTATEVFPDGTLAAAPTWRASEMLNPPNRTPEDRVIVTFDRGAGEGVPFRYGSLSPEQQLSVDESQVDFLRGVRTNEAPAGALRERPPAGGLLGDIVNSSPVFVGAPRGFNRDQAPYPVDDLYSDFVQARTAREPIVYVGANDGILHGFNAETGLERYGFVPNKILDATQSYGSMLEEFTSPFYLHQYYVDLTPRLNDVYTRASAAVVGKSWNTVLVGGLGVGGKGFFALNVDDPSGNYNNELNAARTVLWEFTDEDDTYPVDDLGNPLVDVDGNPLLDPLGQPVKDLGYAMSLPTVAMTNADDGGAPAEKEWAAIFGNGLNSTAGIAKLFVLFMDRGIDGWDSGDFVKLDTGYGVPIAPDPDAGYPNGLGSVAVVDRDLNGTGDWVYAGDRMGNLHRFDISDPDPDNWTSTLLFTASYDDGTTVTRQPILARPLVVKHPTETGFLVIFGTGSHVAREDANNEDIQSIYAIWDRGESNPATALADSKSLRLVEQEITNLVDDSVSPAQGRRAITSNAVNYTPESGTPGTYGWYIDFDMQRATDTLSGAPNPDSSGYAPPDPQYPGEKAIRRLLFRDGTVITTTILPSVGEASCFGARPGSIILFDAVNGGNPTRAVVDFNNDGVVDSGDLVEDGGEQFAAGLLFNQEDLDGTLVDLSTLGGEGDTDFLFVSGGSETTSFRIDDINDSRTGRLSWRELEQ